MPNKMPLTIHVAANKPSKKAIEKFNALLNKLIK